MKGILSVFSVAVFLCARSSFAIPAGHEVQVGVKTGVQENVTNETEIGVIKCKDGSRVPVTRDTYDRLHELCGEEKTQIHITNESSLSGVQAVNQDSVNMGVVRSQSGENVQNSPDLGSITIVNGSDAGTGMDAVNNPVGRQSVRINSSTLKEARIFSPDGGEQCIGCIKE